jgi:hypothetical protein
VSFRRGNKEEMDPAQSISSVVRSSQRQRGLLAHLQRPQLAVDHRTRMHFQQFVGDVTDDACRRLQLQQARAQHRTDDFPDDDDMVGVDLSGDPGFGPDDQQAGAVAPGHQVPLHLAVDAQAVGEIDRALDDDSLADQAAQRRLLLPVPGHHGGSSSSLSSAAGGRAPSHSVNVGGSHVAACVDQANLYRS